VINTVRTLLTWGDALERVTRIELALSAWESHPGSGKRPASWAFVRGQLTAGAHHAPWLAAADGTKMARGGVGSWHRTCRREHPVSTGRRA